MLASYLDFPSGHAIFSFRFCLTIIISSKVRGVSFNCLHHVALTFYCLVLLGLLQLDIVGVY